jgi:hypothetical protein
MVGKSCLTTFVKTILWEMIEIMFKMGKSNQSKVVRVGGWLVGCKNSVKYCLQQSTNFQPH